MSKNLTKNDMTKRYGVKGRKSWKMSEDTKKKMSNSHKGKPKTGGVQKGHKQTEEHKKHLSSSHLGITKGKNNGIWKGGLTHTEKLEIKAGRRKPKACEICGRETRICFDHDHKTGKFRGWICEKCNLALGMVEDNAQILEMLIRYIKINNL